MPASSVEGVEYAKEHGVDEQIFIHQRRPQQESYGWLILYHNFCTTVFRSRDTVIRPFTLNCESDSILLPDLNRSWSKQDFLIFNWFNRKRFLNSTSWRTSGLSHSINSYHHQQSVALPRTLASVATQRSSPGSRRGCTRFMLNSLIPSGRWVSGEDSWLVGYGPSLEINRKDL